MNAEIPLRLHRLRSPVFLLVAFAMPACAVAQSACPVRIQEVTPKLTQTSSGNARRHSSSRNESPFRPRPALQFTASFLNVSGKPVRGVKVQTAFYDASGQLHVDPNFINAFHDFPMGDTTTINWITLPSIDEDKATGWIAVIRKVIFVDGAVWEFTSSTHACFG